MEWTTHALSGVVAGYLATGDWKGAAVGGIAGVVPDLDEPKSKFGKMTLPISYPLNKVFGHRTFTHSLLFILIMGAIFYVFAPLWVTMSVVCGISAHILGDMVTGKVKVLYPLKTSIGVSILFSMFTIIDRVARLGLIVYLGFIIWNKLM